MRNERETRIGIVGTGFIGRGLTYALRNDESLVVSRVLTRRNPEQIKDLAVEKRQITTSPQELIDNSDIIVECSGDPIYATVVISEAMDAGLKVVTMDSELQITSGSWLAKKKGLLPRPKETNLEVLPPFTKKFYQWVLSHSFWETSRVF